MKNINKEFEKTKRFRILKSNKNKEFPYTLQKKEKVLWIFNIWIDHCECRIESVAIEEINNILEGEKEEEFEIIKYI